MYNDYEIDMDNHAFESPATVNIQHQWMDWGDHTKMVEPNRRTQWIYDGDTFAAHMRGVQRGLEYDRRAVQHLAAYEANHKLPDFRLFYPTTSQIDKGDKYSLPRLHEGPQWRGYQRDPSRFGKLPVISQQLYDGSLSDKSRGEIEHDMRESARMLEARLFDRTGNWR